MPANWRIESSVELSLAANDLAERRSLVGHALQERARRADVDVGDAAEELRLGTGDADAPGIWESSAARVLVVREGLRVFSWASMTPAKNWRPPLTRLRLRARGGRAVASSGAKRAAAGLRLRWRSRGCAAGLRGGLGARLGRALAGSAALGASAASWTAWCRSASGRYRWPWSAPLMSFAGASRLARVTANGHEEAPDRLGRVGATGVGVGAAGRAAGPCVPHSLDFSGSCLSRRGGPSIGSARRCGRHRPGRRPRARLGSGVATLGRRQAVGRHRLREHLVAVDRGDRPVGAAVDDDARDGTGEVAHRGVGGAAERSGSRAPRAIAANAAPTPVADP